jgi:hypothetical protein
VSDKEGAIDALASYLRNNRAPHMNEAIGVLVIDLNASRAGWMRANEMNGAIAEIPWSKSQVNFIGCICDLYLKGRLRWQEAKREITQATTITDAWNTFGEVDNDPYISPSSVASAAVDLNYVIMAHPDQLRALEAKDSDLFETIKGFADKLDQSKIRLVASVTEVDPENQTIIATEGPNSPRVRLSYSDTSTAFMNIGGAKVASSFMKPGTPMVFEMAGKGDERAITKAILGKAGATAYPVGKAGDKKLWRAFKGF